MKKTVSLVLLLFLFFSSISSAFAAETIFIEAEDIQIQSMVVKDNAEAYGGKVITSTEKEQSATIEFEVKEGGKYTMWFRVFHTNELDNSLFYSMDKEEERWVFDFYDDKEKGENFNKWYWWKLNFRHDGVLYNKKEYDLAPGKHTFDMFAREVGGLVDKIIITNDLSYDPSTISGDPEKQASAAGSSDAGTSSSGTSNPGTGDAGTIAYLMTALAALLALIGLIMYRKKVARMD